MLTVVGDEHASYYAEDGTVAPVDYDAGACDGSSRGVGHTEHDFSPVVGGCCRNAAGVSGEFDRIVGISIEACAVECAGNASCAGYEYFDSTCEIHIEEIDPISTSANSAPGCACFSKDSMCRDPAYVVPDAAAVPTNLTLGIDLWGLIPTLLQTKLAADYPWLQDLVGQLNSWLDTDFVRGLWAQYANQLPKLRDLVTLFVDDIKDVDVGDLGAVAWLVGGPTCSGSLADRASSPDKQCTCVCVSFPFFPLFFFGVGGETGILVALVPHPTPLSHAHARTHAPYPRHPPVSGRHAMPVGVMPC